MKPAYIAGPYMGPDAETIRLNVWKALCVGALAGHRGLAPIVPHAQGYLGVYGPADESDPGVRPRALACSGELARQVGLARGELWVIERDDGKLSAGTYPDLILEEGS